MNKQIQPIRSKWKSSMTDRERFNNQMHYKKVDRCFNMEFGYWDENFETWDVFKKNGVENNQQADILFQFDRIETIRANVWLSPPFENKIIDETEDKYIIMNNDGLTAEVPKDGHDTIPHYIKASVQTPDDWKKVKKERLALDESRKVDIENLKKIHKPDRDYPLGVHCGSMIGKIRDMLTFEGLCYAIYDYPKMIEDMVETFCILVEYSLDQLLPHFDFDFASGWEDICFKNGPIVPPKFCDV